MAFTSAALTQQRGVCYYCSTKLSVGAAQGDHKTPVSRGGRTTSRNIVAACARCNTEKHKKTEREYRRWRRSVGRV